MKYLSLFATLLLLTACQPEGADAVIETQFGNIYVDLYDTTPQHRDNFEKLVRDGFYDGLLFHRVMSEFMVQGGDPDSRGAAPGAMLGNGGPGYTIPAEIGGLHVKGALSAARQPDQVNPQKASSGSQFYLVQGKVWTDAELDQIEQRQRITYSPEQRELYKTVGGTPFLDNDYTVFGEVVDGLAVIDSIAAVATNPANRPLEDVPMTIKWIQ